MKFLIAKEQRNKKGNKNYRQRRWAEAAVSFMMIMGIVLLVAACGSTDTPDTTGTVNNGTTPAATSIDDTPTAALGTTPPATANGATPTVAPPATPGSTGNGTTPTTVPGAPPPTPIATAAPTTQPTTAPTTQPTTAPPTGNTVTVWIQTTDSCKQALSGATFSVNGPGINTVTPATSGGVPLSLPGGVVGQCPIQQGTCNFPTGCTSINLNLPASGTATYTITVARTAPGYGSNLSYAICTGGSDCRHGPEVATVNISSSGAVSATVLNPYPDGTTVTWPTNKAAYSGTINDPIMFHEFGIGNGSITCDGDHDADDYLTGTLGAHCDSDQDQTPGH